jgi:DNA mismatch endonuclease (patch repair protein)
MGMAKLQKGDIVPPSIRSHIMKSVGQRNTSAELRVRKLVTSLGFRYRLHNRSLPGSPDLSNVAKRWAIFVNGCFWHGHKNCPKTKSGRNVRIPVSNDRFWKVKIADNRSRDARKIRQLRAAGFRIIVIWECQFREPKEILRRVRLLVYGTGRKFEKTE